MFISHDSRARNSPIILLSSSSELVLRAQIAYRILMGDEPYERGTILFRLLLNGHPFSAGTCSRVLMRSGDREFGHELGSLQLRWYDRDEFLLYLVQALTARLP